MDILWKQDWNIEKKKKKIKAGDSFGFCENAIRRGTSGCMGKTNVVSLNVEKSQIRTQAVFIHLECRNVYFMQKENYLKLTKNIINSR